MPAPAATRPWWLEDVNDALNSSAVGDGTWRLVDESLPDPIAVAVAVANEAIRVVRVESARPLATDRSMATAGYGDLQWLHLER